MESTRASSNCTKKAHTHKRGSKAARANALFDPFRLLMIPLSGVAQMVLLTKGKQKIFLIGEYHSRVFCRELGFTPIAEIIEGYLEDTHCNAPVDFMLEMENADIPYHEAPFNVSVDEMRDLVKQEKNGYFKGERPFTIMTMTRVLVQDAKRRQTPTRVHWLEPHYPPPKTPSRGDQLIAEFNLFIQHFHSIEEKYALYDSLVYFNQRAKINQLLLDATGFELPWYDENESEGRFSSNFYSSKLDGKIAFFEACYNTLSTSKFFIKCRKEDPRNISLDVYRNAFFDMYKKEPNRSIVKFYFHVQRFIMDMFTTCRIMKTYNNPHWFNNIVIYAGDWHVQNYIHILTQLGYERHELPIHYNPHCRHIAASDP